jgi:hypothetical protein
VVPCFWRISCGVSTELCKLPDEQLALPALETELSERSWYLDGRTTVDWVSNDRLQKT